MVYPSINWKVKAWLAALLGMLIILLCWQFMVKPHEIKSLQRESAATARELRASFSSQVEHYVLRVKQFFSRVEPHDYHSYEKLVDDVHEQFKQYHGLEAVVFPSVGAKASVALFNPYIIRTGALTSKKQCDSFMQEHPELISTYQNMQVISVKGSLCVYDTGSNMLAIFNLKTILEEDLKHEMMKGYFLALSNKITPDLVSPDWSIPLVHREFFEFFGGEWDINIYPSKAYVEARVKRVYIIFCTVLGALMSLFFFWFLKFRWQLIPLNSCYVNQLERLAKYDGLTELPNREYCLDHLKTMLTRSNRGTDCFSVCFLDCNNFKQINDAYGHHVGDLALKHVAQAVSQVIRCNDFFSRFSGDEFCLILDGTASEKAIKAVLDKIFKALSIPMEFESHQIIMTVSIGVAMYPDSAQSAELLLKRADEAMYSAKTQIRTNAYAIYAS